jgi:hypothetical protein
MALRDHPGFFGVTSRGVIAIHADWPIYPEEHGSDLALLWLTTFPEPTTFKCIDDIDQCCLLLANVKGSNLNEPFADRNFHVAIWHEDLIGLHEKGFVSGVDGVLTEREWYDRILSDIPPGPYFFELKDGTLKEVEFPRDSDQDDTRPYAAQVAREGLRVTTAGLSRATSLLANLEDDFKILGDRVPPLLTQGYFDTAVREACIGIESRIKASIASNCWGDTLANEFIIDLRKSGRFLESYLRVLRGQLRTALKFIRNDVMHNFLSMNETECRAILLRLVRVRSQIESVCADMTSRQLPS